MAEKANPTNNYLYKVNNKNKREGCEICSKLTPERCQRRRSGVIVDSFGYISHVFLEFLLLTLNR